jgi:hypothetical protein
MRLRHKTLKDCNFTVVSSRPLTEPFFCPQCQVVETFKTYHLRLNSDGEVDVSKTVYDRLAELDDLPLTKVSSRAKPKPQVLIVSPLGGNGQPPIFQIPEKLAEAAQYAIAPVPTKAFVPKSMRRKVKGSG